MRGIEMKGIHKYSSTVLHKDRFLNQSFNYAECYNMYDIYDHFVSSKEKSRMTRLELLDEVEEWIMLCRHYCVCWSVKSEHNVQDLKTALMAWSKNLCGD